MNFLNHIKLRYKILVFPAVLVLVVAGIYYTTHQSNLIVGSNLTRYNTRIYRTIT